MGESAHLRPYDEQLFRLGSLAERYFPDDPNTALLKLRQLGELLAQYVASRFGVELREEETQQLRRRRLECDGVLEREVAEQLAHTGATGCSASPTKRRRSRSWIAKPSTTTPCCSAGRAAAGRA